MNAHQLDADGVIINTVVVDSLDALPDLIDASIGGTIGDRVVDGVVVPATPTPAVDALPHITKLAFRNRFTTAEKVIIDLASIDNPGAPMPARQQAAAVRVSLADAAAASYIDLSREDTRAGVQMLEVAGILGTGRALEILDAEILDGERVQ